MARCNNASCSARLKESILHFAHRSAMDIDGLGAWLVDAVVDGGLVKDFADLYMLTEVQLAELKKDAELGEERAVVLVDAIARSKREMTLARVLYALGIPGVGNHKAKMLASDFSSLEALANAAADDVARVEGIGSRDAASVRAFFEAAQNRRMVALLGQAGMPVGQEARDSVPAKPVPGHVDRAAQPFPPDEETAFKKVLRRFVLGSASNVTGFGNVLAGKLVTDGLVQAPGDLYLLTVPQLARIPTQVKLGAKSAKSIVNSLQESKTRPLARLVYGLGIRHVGERTAELLVERFPSIDSLVEASTEQLEEVEEVGPRIAESIRAFFQSGRNMGSDRPVAPARSAAGGGTAAGPADGGRRCRRQGVRSDRDAREHVARGGIRTHQGSGRQGHGVRQQ